MEKKDDQRDSSLDLLPQFNSNHWDQFEKFRKRICQDSDEKNKSKESYSQLERIQKQQSSVNNTIEADRVLKLRVENQELKDLVIKYEKQMKETKEKYEEENKELVQRLNQFTEELEELKKVYKDKNMKLYNLVLQLEKEKQELIDKNIQMLEQKQQQQKPLTEERYMQNQIRSLQEQVRVLEEKNAKLLFEKNKLTKQVQQDKENILLTPNQKPIQHFRDSIDKPPRQFALETSNLREKEKVNSKQPDKKMDKSKKKKQPKTPSTSNLPQSTKNSARDRSFTRFENQTPVQKKKILKRSSTNTNFEVMNSQSILRSQQSCLKKEKSVKKIIPKKKKN